MSFNSIEMFTNLTNASAQMHPELYDKDVVCVLLSGANFHFSLLKLITIGSTTPT